MTRSDTQCGAFHEGAAVHSTDKLAAPALTEATNALARLFGDAQPLSFTEAEAVTETLAEIAPDQMRPYADDPEVFSRAWQDVQHWFTGPLHPLKLEESVYKPWTEENSHPLKGQIGHSWGDPASHMSRVLEEFGLALPEDAPRAPDHLAVLLEFLGFLLERRTQEEISAFCDDHLDWLDHLERTAEEMELPPIFTEVVTTAKRLVRAAAQ